MKKLKIITVATMTFIMVLTTGCWRDRNDLVELARLNGKLNYEYELMKWCKKNNVYVNFEQVDSSYYAACKTCY